MFQKCLQSPRKRQKNTEKDNQSTATAKTPKNSEQYLKDKLDKANKEIQKLSQELVNNRPKGLNDSDITPKP